MGIILSITPISIPPHFLSGDFTAKKVSRLFPNCTEQHLTETGSVSSLHVLSLITKFNAKICTTKMVMLRQLEKKEIIS